MILALQLLDEHMRFGIARRNHNYAPLQGGVREPNDVDLRHRGDVGAEKLLKVALQLICIRLCLLDAGDAGSRGTVDQESVVVVFRPVGVCDRANVLEQFRLGLISCRLKLSLRIHLGGFDTVRQNIAKHRLQLVLGPRQKLTV